jgi:hypothetical protein
MTEQITEAGNGDGIPDESTLAAAVPFASAAAPPPVEYVASLYPGPDVALPTEFADACKRLADGLGGPLWLIVQESGQSGEEDPYGELGPVVRNAFFRARRELAACNEANILVDSPGGYARSAYEIARLFQRHCGSFTAVVPRYAKSAATLFVLGGSLMMGDDAELGPLDAQLWDAEREERLSALNEVQTLEQLHLQAIEEVDQMVPLLVARTGKKTSTLLPLVLDFVASMKAPLLGALDTVHYTQQARVLKEAEDYATRLLRMTERYSEREVEAIPRRLVRRYSDHSFVIDRREASEFLRLEDVPAGQVADAIADLADFITDKYVVALGRFDVKTT